MEAYKREFIQFLQDAGVLKFGDFTAKSGRKIPYFINAGMIKTGDQITKMGEFYAKAYFDKLPDYVQSQISTRSGNVNSFDSLQDYAENLTRGDN